jgi:hypothetical protein
MTPKGPLQPATFSKRQRIASTQIIPRSTDCENPPVGGNASVVSKRRRRRGRIPQGEGRLCPSNILLEASFDFVLRREFAFAWMRKKVA